MATSNTTMDLITATEAKRVYKLSDEDIKELDVVVAEKKKDRARCYKRSQVEFIVNDKAEFPEYRSNKRTFTQMIENIDKIKMIAELKQNIDEYKEKKRFTDFTGVRSDQPFAPNVLENIVKIMANKTMNGKFKETVDAFRNMSEACKEFHAVVFEKGFPNINKKRLTIKIAANNQIFNKRIQENYVKKYDIFSKLMKDPLLLSNRDLKMFKTLPKAFNNNFSLLHKVVQHFNISGPIRIPFKTWFFIQFQMNRFNVSDMIRSYG